MKKGEKRGLFFLAGCMLAVLLAGCGGSGGNSSSQSMEMEGAYDTSAHYDTGDIYAGAAEPAEAVEAAAEEGPGSPAAEVDEEASSNRKLIKNVYMDVETEDYPTLISTVTGRVGELGGYIEQYDAYNENSIGNRNCSLTIRIPSGKLDGFLAQVGEMSNVLSRRESVEDVTLQYVDMESHKKMLREEQERLLELLEKAGTMEDIIAIESRLTDVRYQLESLEAQLRTIDNQVDYSTVWLSVSEVQRYTPPVEKGTWERIRIGFAENVYRVGDGLKEFFIGFVISLPVLFVWIVLIAAVALVVRLIVRAAEKGNEKRRRERGQQAGGRPLYGAAGRNVPPMMHGTPGPYGPAGGPAAGPGYGSASTGMPGVSGMGGTPGASGVPEAGETAGVPGEGGTAGATGVPDRGTTDEQAVSPDEGNAPVSKGE